MSISTSMGGWLDAMISRRIRLEDVNDAFAEMKRGEVARSVITFDI